MPQVAAKRAPARAIDKLRPFPRDSGHWHARRWQARFHGGLRMQSGFPVSNAGSGAALDRIAAPSRLAATVAPVPAEAVKGATPPPARVAGED